MRDSGFGGGGKNRHGAVNPLLFDPDQSAKRISGALFVLAMKRHNGGVSKIMRKMVITVMGALLASSPASAQSLANGEHIARTKCALCHTVETEKSDPKRQHRAPSFTTIAHRPEVNGQFLDSYLSQHHRNMPNFFLTYTEIGDVSAYILSLRK